MSYERDSKYYTTEREIYFLNKLGTHSENASGLSVANMLRGYIEGAAKRARWGQIDMMKVINHADKLLATEMAATQVLNNPDRVIII